MSIHYTGTYDNTQGRGPGTLVIVGMDQGMGGVVIHLYGYAVMWLGTRPLDLLDNYK